jgi:hypothetical protein
VTVSDPRETSDLDFADVPDPLGYPPTPADAADVKAPSEASPTRAQRDRRTLVAEIIVGAWLLAAVFRLGVREDLGLGLLVRVAVLCVAGLAAQRIAAAPGRALGPRLRVVQAVVVAVPLVFALVAMVGSRGPLDTGLEPAALGPCFSTTLAVAAVPLGFAALLHRHAFAVLPAWRGAALGALGGLMAATVMCVHCTVDATPHVLLAHGAPIVVGALVGALLGALVGKL